MTENPYASEAAAVSPEYVGSSTIKPTGITVIGILTLILAGFGLLGGAIGLASPILFKGFQEQIIAEAEKNPENSDLQFQAKLQRNAIDLAEKYKLPSMVLHGITLVVCLGLFAGAILLLTGSATGRALLAGLFLVILVCDVGKAILTYVVQKEQMTTMSDGMSDMMAGNKEMPAEAQEVATKVTKVATVATLVMTLGWFFVKAFFYVWGWIYLRKQNVISWFQMAKTAQSTGTA